MQIFALFLCVFVVVGAAQAADTLVGPAYATRFKDGDTFVARLDGGRIITVRLWGADTPETKQPWGTEATEALVALAQNPLSLSCPRADRNGRWTCRVRNGSGTDINLALIEQGHAWWDKRFAKEAMEF